MLYLKFKNTFGWGRNWLVVQRVKAALCTEAGK